MNAPVFQKIWLLSLSLIFFGLSSAPAAIRDVTAYGAMGNGTTDDTAAINGAIAALVPGDTLLFPCGTYLTTSQLNIRVSNVTIDGSGCAIIHSALSGFASVLIIGASGSPVPSYGPAVALGAVAPELATSFTTASSLGVSPGDYVYISQGGLDYSTDTPPGHATNCDVSGCRGEVLKVQSVSGNTITVTTALHDAYDPSLNAAVVQKMLSPVAGVIVQNITFEGTQALDLGLGMSGVVESQVQGVTARNVQGAAIYSVGSFNLSFGNINVTQAGSDACGDAFYVFGAGNMTVNGMSISNENPGTGTGCLGNGAFGLGLHTLANSTFTNVTVDATGAYGRPFKTTAARWSTFNSPTVKNSPALDNGITIQYYSSHNTYNNCVVTNNGAGTGTGTGNAGINSFGNFNQHNTFNSCTVTGNGNVQLLVNNYDSLRLGTDSYVTINGGTFTGATSLEPVILIAGSNSSVISATINGQGLSGIWIGSTDACVNNNTLTSLFNFEGIHVYDPSTDVGTGNILNGNSSNLSVGQCSPPGTSSGP